MPFKKTAMKASRRLTSKKYKDDQKVKNTTSHAHIIEQIKIEDVEPQEEQVKKTQIDEFLENVEPLSSIPNSKHRGYMANCSLNCLHILHSPIWALNRKIDRDHVRLLFDAYEKDVKNSQQICFFDMIHITYNICSDEVKVIEGQHRIQALEEIRRKYPEYECKFPAILWNVSDDNDMMHLLHIVNNRKHFELEENISYEISDIVSTLSDHFQKNIWGEFRPFMSKPVFIERLKQKIDHIRQEYDSVEDYVVKLIQINEDIGKLPKYKRGGGTKSTNEKAEEMGFFLGLDKEMKWL
jgi:hypothetical protein